MQVHDLSITTTIAKGARLSTGSPSTMRSDSIQGPSAIGIARRPIDVFTILEFFQAP
jgi:hypothetical protein